MSPHEADDANRPFTQADVMAFLLRPETHGGAAVQHIETHLSHLILAGDRVFKLKKAQRWSVVDASTLAQREAFCRRELAVNGIAGGLYRGLRRVSRAGDGFALDGDGPTAEWLVEMHRFADRAQLDMMVEDGTMDGATADATADAIAKMHRAAPISRVADGARRTRALAEQLCRDTIAQAVTRPAEADAATAWLELAIAAIEAEAGRIDRRARHGFVRRCHGDLHLSNICVFEGRPVPFDAIEFSEEIATIDVLYDLAFVLVDLEERGRADLSARMLSDYLDWTRDYSGLALVPLFVSLRAMVRALTRSAKGFSPAGHIETARAALAERRPCRLIAVGGLSGSGKSTVARAISATSGAVVIRSDAVRKHVFGVDPREHLGPAAYTPAVSARVYHRMMVNAQRALAAGWPVILDATFMGEAERTAAADLARTMAVPFLGAWLDVPVEVMLARVRARKGDVSDADAGVVAKQREMALGPIAWRRFNGEAAPDETAASILAQADTGR